MITTKDIGKTVQYTGRNYGTTYGTPNVFAGIIAGVNTDGTAALSLLTPQGLVFVPTASFSDASPGSETALGKWAHLPN